MQTNIIYNQDSAIGLKELPSDSIDCVITSPPYDDIREYNGYSFNFEEISFQLYRVCKNGSTVVWVVNDKVENGSRSLTSFKQAIHFNKLGFNINDVMIYAKKNPMPNLGHNVRYNPSYEFMLILTKGKPKTVNLLEENCYSAGKEYTGKEKWGRNSDGRLRSKDMRGVEIKETRPRNNIWYYGIGSNVSTDVKEHPAVYPLELVIDHILSWTNKGDIVLDCFMGSGTTAIACIQTHRQYIGYEISKEYVDMANKRIMKEPPTLDVW